MMFSAVRSSIGGILTEEGSICSVCRELLYKEEWWAMVEGGEKGGGKKREAMDMKEVKEETDDHKDIVSAAT